MNKWNYLLKKEKKRIWTNEGPSLICVEIYEFASQYKIRLYLPQGNDGAEASNIQRRHAGSKASWGCGTP